MAEFEHLKGLVAAPHTPFLGTGDLAVDQIPKQIAVLAAQKLAGVFLCGTTGEGLSMSGAERRLVAESWTRQAPAGLKIVVHVGHHCLPEAVELAAHAATCGAHGVATMAPSFIKAANVNDLLAYCEPIAAAAPELPFYFYHIPSMTGVNLSMTAFLQAAATRIPNLAGIKFTHQDLMEFQRLRAFDDGRFDILWGVDEALLGALAVGATGAIGSTYNYASSIYHRMIAAFHASDLETARKCSLDAVHIVELLLEFGVLASGKALMALHGLDCGDTRPPAARLSESGKAALLEKARRLGVIESVSTAKGLVQSA